MDIAVQFKYSKEFISACIPKYDFYDKGLGELNLSPYDYQEESVKRMLKFGRGCILIGTGGGKTFIMSLFAKTVIDNIPDNKFIIVVPTIQLVEQTYNDFLDYGFDKSIISKWSGDNDFQNTQIIVASVSILQSKNSDLSFLKHINTVMVDEVHILKKDNLINKILDTIPTMNRFGFTGTMPEERIDQWNVTGKIGPQLYEKGSYELRDGEFISEAKIDVIRVNYNNNDTYKLHKMLEETDKKYIAELDFMIENEYRNSLIAHTALATRKNCLIMVDRIKHGEILEDLLNKHSKHHKIYFIQGDVAVDDREKIREIMESENDIICIAISKIFSTGINIKNIHQIIFATPGKAKVKLIQSIGRGLRLHENKNFLKVIDFSDNLHYSNKHLEKRKKLYQTEKLNYEIRNIKQKQ